MPIIEFAALPLPHYLNSGFNWSEPGRKHLERYALGEFDLLVVQHGCLYIGEEDRRYEVEEGQALILRPDLHHYPTSGYKVPTATFWLHFQTRGRWSVVDGGGERDEAPGAQPGLYSLPEELPGGGPGVFRDRPFTIRVPQYAPLAQPAHMYDALRELTALERDSHLDAVRWRQQVLFQEVLRLLGEPLAAEAAKPGAGVADQAASYLRARYREQVTAKELGEALNFHPVYIARCMQKQFGCSPMEYLTRCRIDQAKLLLLQTDQSVSRIAQEVGFQQAAYFTSCFGRYEGVTPTEYRQRHVGRKP